MSSHANMLALLLTTPLVFGCNNDPEYTQRSLDASSGRPILVTPPSGDATDDSDPDATGNGDDLDNDGLSDVSEDQLIAEYLPYLSLHPLERCGGPIALVYRVSPHPTNNTQIAVRAALLFERACGLQPSTGSIAGFGFSVDTQDPAPAGLRALTTRTCTGSETCSQTCSSEPPCRTTTPSGVFPVIYFSKDDHNAYLSEATCTGSCNLSDVCTIGTDTLNLIAINAGEPDTPRVTNLTTAGVITTQNGWSEARLMDIDPWSSAGFGDDASIASIINSTTFLAPGCSAD